MKTKVEVVTDLITGLDLTKDEYSGVLDFILTQSGLKITLLNAEVKKGLDEIRALVIQNNDILSLGSGGVSKAVWFGDPVDIKIKEELPEEFVQSIVAENTVVEGTQQPEEFVQSIVNENTAAEDANKSEAEEKTVVVETEEKVLETKSAETKDVTDVTIKRKRGRPRKNPIVVKDKKPSEPEKVEASQASDAGIVSEEAKTANDEQPKLSRRQLRVEASRNAVLPSEKDLDGLKMGSILSLGLLYKTQEGVVEVDQKLDSLMPLGVCVKYKYSINTFAVSTYEMTGMSMRDAAAYAKTLPKVNGNSWMVMTPQQRDACKSRQVDLNQILKKVGGDVYGGDYLTNPLSCGSKKDNLLKVRFAVEL